MKKKIIISGIKGFLGNRLKDLLQKDFELYGIDKETSLEEGIKTYSSEILEEIDVKPDFLILCHAAVSSGSTMLGNDLLYKVNVSLTEKIVAKFQTSKIIFISTASIYNLESGVISESTIDSPQNAYSITKYWTEKVVLNTNRAVVVRLSSLYGTNMKENTIIPNYINQALSNNTIEVWGQGERYQNYIHVDDVCNLVNEIVEQHATLVNEIILAVHNKEYSNLDLAKIIASETRSNVEFVKTDNSISLHYDNKKTQALLNWAPKANFKKEISNYIKWKQKRS